MKAGLIICLSLMPLLTRAETGSPKDKSGGVYAPEGKRDPFQMPRVSTEERDVASINSAEKFSIDQFQLRAILRGEGRARAMFEDPEGNIHIIGEGEFIGRERGTLSRILDRELIITIMATNYLGVESIYEKHVALPKK